MSDQELDRSKIDREFLIKQCEWLQATIKRMADNSLEVKKFGLAIWAAIVGFGFTNKNSALFALAFIAFVLFGLLDIYYLYLEQRFRDNYNRLVRIVMGYASNKDYEWVEQVKGNVIKPDFSTTFPKQLPSMLRSWANLPYLITFLLTIVLWKIPLSS